MRHVPHRLEYLKTNFPFSDTIWGDLRMVPPCGMRVTSDHRQPDTTFTFLSDLCL